MAVVSANNSKTANEVTALYRPREVAERLGIAAATLRLWSNEFGDALGPAARKPSREGLGAAQRRYTDDDLHLLLRSKALLGQGLTYEEARRRLGEPPARPPDAAEGTLALDGLDALRERLPRLPRKQYRLAQALLKTPEKIVFGSVRELAAELDVNNATIIRFAQSLGYSGYGALQHAVRQAYLPRAGLEAPRDTAARSSPDSAVAATLAGHRANLDLASRRLLDADLDGIADALVGARRCLVCASGTPVVVATLLVRLLRHVGLRGELIASGDIDPAIAMYDLGPEDVVVGIGFWLTFRGIVDALDLARRRGATTIAISGSPTSPLARVADHLLVVPAQGAAISFSAVATVATVEGLIAHIAGRRPRQTAEIEQTLHDLYLQEDLFAPLLPPDK